MIFYGTRTSIERWKEIIETELGIPCGVIITEADRDEEDLAIDSVSFHAELTCFDRAQLQDQFWHVVEDGQEWQWNCRISFVE